MTARRKRYARRPRRLAGYAGRDSDSLVVPLVIAGGVIMAVFLKKTVVGAVSQVVGYVNGKQTPIQLVAIGGYDKNGDPFRLRSDAASMFLAMKAAALQDNVALVPTTAFRDMSFQQKLYAMYLAGTGSLAAKPGYSNHQGGIAIDLETANGTNQAFGWLNANAARFGFRRTVASEPWHWEFA